MSASSEKPAMPDPSLLIGLAVACRASVALFAANNLNVFTTLATGPLAAEQLAESCAAHPRPMTMLLNTCLALGPLERRQNLHANTRVADAFLVQGKPGYIGEGLKYSFDLYLVGCKGGVCE